MRQLSIYLSPSLTAPSNQPIRIRYLGHMTGYQPIRDQYFPQSYPTCPVVRRSQYRGEGSESKGETSGDLSV